MGKKKGKKKHDEPSDAFLELQGALDFVRDAPEGERIAAIEVDLDADELYHPSRITFVVVHGHWKDMLGNTISNFIPEEWEVRKYEGSE